MFSLLKKVIPLKDILNFIGVLKGFIASMVMYKSQNLFAQPFCPAERHVGCRIF